MLISPLRLHHDLTSLLTSPAAASSSSASTTGSPHGPHTALLILPEGRLLASTSRYDELYADDGGYETGVEAGDEADGADTDAGEGGGEDEPYLDEPERIRLLCGLASQWEEDESPRVECEVSPLAAILFRLVQCCMADHPSSAVYSSRPSTCLRPNQQPSWRRTSRLRKASSRICLCWS